MRRYAARGLEQHQVLGRHADANIGPDPMIGVAREDRLQLRARRQLQAIQGRRAQQGLAYYPGVERGVWRIDDIVEPEQFVH